MSSINKVILIGHLGADPDMRATGDGRKIANFSIATSERWKDKSTGEQKERTEWHRIVVFNEGLAGIAEKYLKKGSKVYVEGALQTRKWEKDGVERYSTEVVLKGFSAAITLLDRAERHTPSEDEYGTTRTRAPATSSPGKRDDMDDEIPF